MIIATKKGSKVKQTGVAPIKVLGKCSYTNGALFQVCGQRGDDKRLVSTPTLARLINEKRISNATIVRGGATKQFIRLASGVPSKEVDKPIPMNAPDKMTQNEIQYAMAWAIAEQQNPSPTLDEAFMSPVFKNAYEKVCSTKKSGAEKPVAKVTKDGFAKVPKKEYTGWQPTSVTFDEDGDIVVAKDDCIKVSLVNLDEGINGDYDPDDPDDVNLLRFDVYYRNPEEGLDGWEPVDDASYCTNVEANSTKEHLEKVVRTLFKRYRDEYRNIATGGSVKKMGEELSHIS
jgi:hypothetical protein